MAELNNRYVVDQIDAMIDSLTKINTDAAITLNAINRLRAVRFELVKSIDDEVKANADKTV